MREATFVEAPGSGPVLDAVYVPSPAAYGGGTYLCEFEFDVVKEFESATGHIVNATSLVGIDRYRVRSVISEATRRELKAESRRLSRTDRARCNCGNCGGSFWR